MCLRLPILQKHEYPASLHGLAFYPGFDVKLRMVSLLDQVQMAFWHSRMSSFFLFFTQFVWTREHNNHFHMQNKITKPRSTKGGRLSSIPIQPWSSSFCSENATDLATRTNSLDICCLAPGAISSLVNTDKMVSYRCIVVFLNDWMKEGPGNAAAQFLKNVSFNVWSTTPGKTFETFHFHLYQVNRRLISFLSSQFLFFFSGSYIIQTKPNTELTSTG